MRFSVIVPVYNKEPYINKALNSILSQSFNDFELIVVDDGSTDGSLSVAESVLNASHIPFKLIHQENAGVSTARNKGVAVSQGQFLCFLDADDWWEPEFLENMDMLIDEYPDAGLYGTNYHYIKNGRIEDGITNVETGYINYCRVYAESRRMPIWTGAVSIPRYVYVEMGGFSPRLSLGEDFDLWIRIAMKKKVVFLNKELSNYNQDSNPKWRSIKKLHNPDSHMLWNLDYLSEEEKNNIEYKQVIDNLRTYGLLPYYLSNKYRVLAKEELAKVNWGMQPKWLCSLYEKPIWFLKVRQALLNIGSPVKQWILRFL